MLLPCKSPAIAYLVEGTQTEEYHEIISHYISDWDQNKLFKAENHQSYGEPKINNDNPNGFLCIAEKSPFLLWNMMNQSKQELYIDCSSSPISYLLGYPITAQENISASHPLIGIYNKAGNVTENWK